MTSSRIRCRRIFTKWQQLMLRSRKRKPLDDEHEAEKKTDQRYKFNMHTHVRRRFEHKWEYLKTERRVGFQFHLGKRREEQAKPCLAKNDMTFTQNKSICKHAGSALLLDHHRSTNVQFLLMWFYNFTVFFSPFQEIDFGMTCVNLEFTFRPI